MKLLLAATTTLMLVTGYVSYGASALEPSGLDSATRAASNSEVAVATFQLASNKFAPKDADKEELIKLLGASCGRADRLGVTETVQGRGRSVLLPRSKAVSSNRAFYVVPGVGSGLFWTTEDFISCQTFIQARQFLDSSGSGATLAKFPLKVQRLTASRFAVEDRTAGDKGALRAIYKFKSGLLRQVKLNGETVIDVRYGKWTKKDRRTLKKIVDSGR
jgi:hypothetical protein